MVEEDMEMLRDHFNTKLSSAGIESCELMRLKSIMHYQEKKTRFVKVTATTHKFMKELRATIEKGLCWADDMFWNTTFESSLPQALRFMVD